MFSQTLSLCIVALYKLCIITIIIIIIIIRPTCIINWFWYGLENFTVFIKKDFYISWNISLQKIIEIVQH